MVQHGPSRKFGTSRGRHNSEVLYRLENGLWFLHQSSNANSDFRNETAQHLEQNQALNWLLKHEKPIPKDCAKLVELSDLSHSSVPRLRRNSVTRPTTFEGEIAAINSARNTAQYWCEVISEMLAAAAANDSLAIDKAVIGIVDENDPEWLGSLLAESRDQWDEVSHIIVQVGNSFSLDWFQIGKPFDTAIEAALVLPDCVAVALLSVHVQLNLIPKDAPRGLGCAGLLVRYWDPESVIVGLQGLSLHILQSLKEQVDVEWKAALRFVREGTIAQPRTDILERQSDVPTNSTASEEAECLKFVQSRKPDFKGRKVPISIYLDECKQAIDNLGIEARKGELIDEVQHIAKEKHRASKGRSQSVVSLVLDFLLARSE